MLLFYIPCPDKSTAENIARTLLEEKLVGCANILPGMESIYWWEGKLETSAEHILLLKTLKTSDAQSRIEKRVGELHPYDVPCVMSLPVAAINAPYLSWLAQSMSK